MKVAHFCTFPHGGAAAAAKRLHHGLLEQNVDSHFYYFRDEQDSSLDATYSRVEFPEPTYPGIVGFFKQKANKHRRRRIYHLYDTHLSDRPADQETFSMAELPAATRLDWQSIDADVINLHWLSFFADYPSFFNSIPDEIPIVWTLHDTNAFTGGCHYNNDCLRFSDGCGDCPQVAAAHPHDVSLASLTAKRNSLRQKRIQVVAPCQWMLDLAKQSSVWPRKTKFKKIHYGLDLNTYHPLDKKTAKAKLNLNPETPLVAFGAMEINNPRKGFQHLLPALRMAKADGCNFECLVFGSGEIEQTADLPKLHQLGFVDSRELQRQIYSAADAVVVPSLEDNQPQVGLEAMACGTPVVAFDACGLPEYVIPGKTGFLADTGNEKDLAEKISQLLDAADRKRLGDGARSTIETQFERKRQTQKYIGVYQKMCNNIRSQPATRQ